FNSFLRYLFGPTSTFVNLNLNFQRSLASAQRVFELLDIVPEIKDAKASFPINSVKGKVVFQDVAFSYREKPVLHSLNFSVEPGETVAVVGPSGAGKSTLLNLIPRFFDPDKGQILLDSNNIKDLTVKSLREKIAIIPQDIFLFSDTIKENIAFGTPQLNDEDIVKAAMCAHAHEFIVNLPQQYDTRIGERGATLSGGERQRIAIARAIAGGPDILLMDEGTSQLDAELEEAILNNIRTLMKAKTIFIIAHNLAAIDESDKIIVMDKGTIIGIGKHHRLYRECSIYRKLYDTSLSNHQFS
ncbi:MAG: ABC transporter ATP-binding protein, partial [Spirochaetota bacterium]